VRRPRKISGTCGIKVDMYRLLSDTVESGVEAGWRRAHKHTDIPTAEGIKCEIEKEIMNKVSEIFIFPERY
jgi:hypothetical protein